MKTSRLQEMKPLTLLAYWIKERESIRIKKEAGEPRPWTKDEILQRYRFCNIRRMDDKVSQWLLKNWYEPNFNHPNMLVACALARFINLPSTLEIIEFPTVWQPEIIKEKMRTIKAADQAVFNAAYMVRGNDGQDKAESVVDYYCTPLYRDRPDINPASMRYSWHALIDEYGMGSFMAGQVVADLRWATKGTWEDRMTWAPSGPGSIRGMNRLKGRPVGKLLSYGSFIAELGELIPLLQEKLPTEMTSKLEAHDYQNCLCELDKYCRALYGEGRPKQGYNGIGEK